MDYSMHSVAAEDYSLDEAITNAQRAPGREPRKPYKHRGDINRPLWFLPERAESRS